MPDGVSYKTFRQELVDLMVSGVVINEVFIEGLESSLGFVGVTIESVGSQYAVFNQAGSGGVSRLVAPIDKIAALDY